MAFSDNRDIAIRTEALSTKVESIQEFKNSLNSEIEKNSFLKDKLHDLEKKVELLDYKLSNPSIIKNED